MNDYLLQLYIERLTKDDINNFGKTNGITLESDELDIIYNYLKCHWRTFYYGNPKELLEELKVKLSSDTYSKIETLYIQAREKLN
ncbi:MAG: hypothetical protein PHT75_03410 [Bacilli bacterium]|nr:hypothetical protein [Bacilli bacterium]MDD3305142.1 hypothetical protein [Bacilli bacterium]MDD4053674.1 hypothetical protein [Bacilli bacterium]MDD4411173.1 hypothetical protein [Bacilli bacterium]